MRDDKPGDLGIRLGFGRVIGTGADAGKIKPSLEVTDSCSGRTLTIELTPEQLAEILASGEARVTADKVSGFKGIRDWGKYHKHMTMKVASKGGDYAKANDPLALPHVALAVAEVERAGYKAEKPSLSHGTWRVTGRRYDDTP